MAGSLLVRESQIIARLLLEHADAKAWHKAIVIDNILQKRSPESSKRQARLIKSRLVLMQPELWTIIDQGMTDAVIQALLAAAIKRSHLLGDFMDQILRSHWQTFRNKISISDWENFLATCTQIDSNLKTWKDSTRNQLRHVIFRILVEAKYINNTGSLELLPVTMVPEVKNYLSDHSEEYVLKCMEIR